MENKRVPIVGSDGKVRFTPDQEQAQQDTDSLTGLIGDLETSKISDAQLAPVLTRLDQLELRLLAVESLMNSLQVSHAIKQDQVTLSGVPDASGVYDQTDTQSSVDILTQLRLTVNAMNL